MGLQRCIQSPDKYLKTKYFGKLAYLKPWQISKDETFWEISYKLKQFESIAKQVLAMV